MTINNDDGDELTINDENENDDNIHDKDDKDDNDDYYYQLSSIGFSKATIDKKDNFGILRSLQCNQ
jgi:hypothetical protein